jgi:hypothetical protein
LIDVDVDVDDDDDDENNKNSPKIDHRKSARKLVHWYSKFSSSYIPTGTSLIRGSRGTGTLCSGELVLIFVNLHAACMRSSSTSNSS